MKKNQKYNINNLKSKSIQELVEIASSLEIENPSELPKQTLIFEILATQTKDGTIPYSGMLEIANDGYGFLRSPEDNFLITKNDAYVSLKLIRNFALRNGDIIECTINKPQDPNKSPAVSRIETINGLSVKQSKNRNLFDNLTPLYSTNRFKFEYKQQNRTGRVIDIFAPMGKGQRGLIVAPPKTGKTEMLKELANGITHNHPDSHLIVLLIDERPEEVTDIQRSVNGEVFYSTFDLPAQNHVRVAELVLEKAKRLVEMKKDVIILMDSITRLARAYNTVIPSSGKVLSGGVDASALHKPKRFFGAARNIEEGGSLSIISTALIETGSKMDEVIFEEFKGTGNSEVVLNRNASNKRVYPAIDITKSGTRKEELLLSKDVLQKTWILRNAITQMEEVEALQFICKKMDSTPTNDDFFNTMNE